jgi:MFS family permease
MSATFASLKYRNYRLWFASALVANIGTWMQRVAQDWVVLTVLTNNSGVAVGIVTALQFLPHLFLSAWAGLLADRVDRRKLLMLTQGGMGVLGLGLGALVLSGAAELWHVYVFATLLGVVSAVDGPVRQTFVAQLVPTRRLANAVGLNSTNFNAARLIGPGLAGLLIAAVGTGWVFVINGIAFGAVIISLTRMRDLHALPIASRAKGQIREGLASMLGLNFQLTSAMMARVEFGRGASEYGILGSVLAIGSLAGALLAARRERPRVRLVLGAAFAFAIAMGIQAVMPTYLGYLLMCIPVGFASLTMLTSANAAIQLSVAPELRGRVMSIYVMVLLGTTPLGSPVVGWIGETYGPRYAVLVGAVATLLVAVLATVWAYRTWHVRVRARLSRSHRIPRPYLQVTYPDLEPEPEKQALAA